MSLKAIRKYDPQPTAAKDTKSSKPRESEHWLSKSKRSLILATATSQQAKDQRVPINRKKVRNKAGNANTIPWNRIWTSLYSQDINDGLEAESDS